MAKGKLTSAVRNRVLERLAEGRSLRAICRDADVPVTPAAVRKVVKAEPAFGIQYARARDRGLDAMADELLDIADDASRDWVQKVNRDGTVRWVLNHEHIQRCRLRCDTIKWYLSKLAPKRYGKRIKQKVTSPNKSLGGLSQEQLLRLAKLLRAAKAP